MRRAQHDEQRRLLKFAPSQEVGAGRPCQSWASPSQSHRPTVAEPTKQLHSPLPPRRQAGRRKQNELQGQRRGNRLELSAQFAQDSAKTWLKKSAGNDLKWVETGRISWYAGLVEARLLRIGSGGALSYTFSLMRYVLHGLPRDT